jgi:hypothetical protein
LSKQYKRGGKEAMQNVDIVIAWVDGNDLELKRKRHKYLTGEDASDAISDTRFASNDEIYYNIASILKYVPFARHIYVVTDNQRPEWIDQFAAQGLCSADKIRVVDHKEIFRGYEQHLPTFNTRSIESMLWNIEGLSDYFIYLNDDFFFNSEAKLEDFLNADQIVVHGHWQGSFALKAKLKYRKFLNKKFGKPLQPKHMVAQMLSADRLGFSKEFFEIHHYPHIVDRNILKNYLLSEPDLLETQIKFKFRSIEQINPITLMNHLKIKNQQAILKPDLALAYLKNENSLKEFLSAIENTEVKYGCMQSLDQFDANNIQKITYALNHKFIGFLPQHLTVSE